MDVPRGICARFNGASRTLPRGPTKRNPRLTSKTLIQVLVVENLGHWRDGCRENYGLPMLVWLLDWWNTWWVGRLVWRASHSTSGSREEIQHTKVGVKASRRLFLPVLLQLRRLVSTSQGINNTKQLILADTSWSRAPTCRPRRDE